MVSRVRTRAALAKQYGTGRLIRAIYGVGQIPEAAVLRVPARFRHRPLYWVGELTERSIRIDTQKFVLGVLAAGYFVPRQQRTKKELLAFLRSAYPRQAEHAAQYQLNAWLHRRLFDVRLPNSPHWISPPLPAS